MNDPGRTAGAARNDSIRAVETRLPERTMTRVRRVPLLCGALIGGLLSLPLPLVAVAEPQRSDQPSPARTVSHDKAQQTPIVIAHRGASGYLPEHTTEAVAFAHALAADYIEQDVVLTKDSVPVVLHDIILDDVTNVASVFPDRRRDDGHWYTMDFSLQELQQLAVHERTSESRAWKDAGTRFPVDVPIFRIATLADHLRLIDGLNRSRRRNAGIYVELKAPAEHRAAGLDVAAVTLQTLAQAGYRSADDRVFLQCFDESEVRRLRLELECRLPVIQLLSEPVTAEQIAEYAKVADGLGVRIQAVISGTQETLEGPVPEVTDLVRIAHQHAMQVHVWTFRTDDLPDFADDPQQLLDWLGRTAGVDGIFADQPDVVLRWRSDVSGQLPQSSPFRLLNGRPAAEDATVEPAGQHQRPVPESR